MQWHKLWIQISYDIKNVKRDLVLLMSLLAPLILTAMIKLGYPPLAQFIRESFHFSVESYYPLIVLISLLVTPFTVGVLGGFLILDERDEQILNYLSITPMSKSQFILYRLGFPVFLCFSMASFMLYITSWEALSFIHFFSILLLSLEAPLVALVMAVYAENKVEGLAIGKVVSFSIAAPIVGFFINSTWRWIGLIFPPFWISEALFTNSNHLAAFLFSGAFLYHVGLLIWLLKKVDRRIG